MNEKNIELTYFQALNAMSQLLIIHYKKTNSEDISDILSNIQIVESDGSTADSGEWERWLESAYEVVGGDPVNKNYEDGNYMRRKDEKLTKSQAFDVVCEYLRSYGTLISSHDILSFLHDLKKQSEWKNMWEKCVEKACTEEGINYMRLYNPNM